MKKIWLFFVVFSLSLSCFSSANAQLLDDEENASDGNDVLFEEIFSDFPETEKDITKVKTFDEAVDVISQKIQKNEPTEDFPSTAPADTSLEGKMFVGIQKNSFKIFRDMSGRSRCSFSVVLKSDLNKDIKTLALNLVYPRQVFAFVFKDVPTKQSQLRHITTGGNICYEMAGVTPDISIHKCKIRATLAADCINYIKWSDDLE